MRFKQIITDIRGGTREQKLACLFVVAVVTTVFVVLMVFFARWSRFVWYIDTLIACSAILLIGMAVHHRHAIGRRLRRSYRRFRTWRQRVRETKRSPQMPAAESDQKNESYFAKDNIDQTQLISKRNRSSDTHHNKGESDDTLSSLQQELRSGVSDERIVELLEQLVRNTAKDDLLLETEREAFPVDTELAVQRESQPAWITEHIPETEQIFAVVRKNWVNAITPAATLLLITLGFCISYYMLLSWSLGALALTFSVWLLVMAWPLIVLLRHVRYALVFTDRAIVKYTGILNIATDRTPYHQLTNFSVNRPWAGRIFGYWSAHIKTAEDDQEAEIEPFLAGRKKLCAYADRIVSHHT